MAQALSAPAHKLITARASHLSQQRITHNSPHTPATKYEACSSIRPVTAFSAHGTWHGMAHGKSCTSVLVAYTCNCGSSQNEADLCRLLQERGSNGMPSGLPRDFDTETRVGARPSVRTFVCLHLPVAGTCRRHLQGLHLEVRRAELASAARRRLATESGTELRAQTGPGQQLSTQYTC
jgi:hypothetical protein